MERQFEVVGETLKPADSADESVLDLVLDLPRTVGLHNRIIHGYAAVTLGDLMDFATPSANDEMFDVGYMMWAVFRL